MKNILIIFTVWFSFQAKAAPNYLENMSLLNYFMDKAEPKGFSGYLHIRQDQILLSKGYGQIDIGKGKPTEKTLFDIGSMTKQFVAAALLKLEAQGKLDLNDPISKYFKTPESKKSISIHSLMNHTSGLGYPVGVPDDFDYEEIYADPKLFYEFFLEYAEQKSPGVFSYNNLAYSLLSQLVANVSGQSYESYLAHEIFPFADMEHTGFNTPGSSDLTLSAMGFEDGKPQFKAGMLPNGLGYDGATGVITNVTDLESWLNSILTNRVLNATQTDKWFKPPLKAEIPYALGWVVEQDPAGNLLSFGHSGATIGFVSQFFYRKKEKQFLLILTNNYDMGWSLGVIEDILEGVLTKDDVDKELNKQRSKCGFKTWSEHLLSGNPWKGYEQPRGVDCAPNYKIKWAP